MSEELARREDAVQHGFCWSCMGRQVIPRCRICICCLAATEWESPRYHPAEDGWVAVPNWLTSALKLAGR